MLRVTLTAVILFSLTFANYPVGGSGNALASNLQQQEVRKREDRREGALAFMVKEVRRELLMLPYYNVFDWLEGEVKEDGTVILRGQVVRPTTKSDAEGRVRQIEGVEQVVNEIEVLPLSPNDDRLRLAVYRALFNWNSPLFRYATQAVPPIHIIIKNGRATLKGVVATEADSRLAYARARGVRGLFEVNNELRVEQPQQ